MRDFIDKKEGKLTIIRFVGFCLMILGVLALITCSFSLDERIPKMIAVAFLVTMLGFAMGFPTLLEGHEGLSTMRIVVFMVTNVICMLLLKIGWNNDVDSLSQIQLDQYWVGVIAFVFGAKAVQSFFESKIAVPKESAQVGTTALEYTNSEIAKLAVAQNEQYLKVKFPNIASISDSVTGPVGSDTHIIAIYLKDANNAGIPGELEALMPDGSRKVILTDIIESAGTAKIQYSQKGSTVSRENRPDYIGSICCGVVSSLKGNNFHGLVTSAHIYTMGSYNDNYNGLLDANEQTPVLVDENRAGKWYYKMLTYDQDLAVVALDEGQQESSGYKKFNNEFHQVTDDDVRLSKPNVTMLSRGGKEVDAYILDYNVALDVNYGGGAVYKKNLILIGTTNDKKTSKPISVAGDSGSCVYYVNSDKLIGILLGRNEKYSLVLPIKNTLETFNLKTI